MQDGALVPSSKEISVVMVPLKEKFLVSVAPAEPARDGRQSVSETLKNILAKDGYADLEGASTLYEAFQHSTRTYPNNKCMGRRVNGGDFEWDSYKTVGEKVEACASATSAAGIEAGAKVGIYAKNSPEWMISVQACNRMSLVPVPLYDTFGREAVEYIVGFSECSLIYVSSSKWATLRESLPVLPTVRTVVYWGPEIEDTQAALDRGVRIYRWEDFLELGRTNPADAVPPKPTDLCTIMFTSGTSGKPKGVMLTHKMLVHCVAAQIRLSENTEGAVPLNETDAFLSYLPLSHIMGRIAEEAFLFTGGRIGYYSGDPRMLLSDVQALQPTIFSAPPRVWERIAAGTKEAMRKSGYLSHLLFQYAYSYKLRNLKAGYHPDEAAPFFDKHVFSKVANTLGGKVRFAVSGSAPLAPHVEEFMRVTMCCVFGQGYGLTESCGASFSAGPDWESFATVGIPYTILEFRLESIPEMNYDALASPPRGEICIRGPTNFAGYYKDPERTAKMLDSEGWLHTGDVGELVMDASLKIIDRKSQIFKLSQGEFVVPDKIEAAYQNLDLISQIYVYGDSTQSRLLAVVVPEEAVFLGAAASKGLSGTFREMVADPRAQAWVLEEMTAQARKSGLQGFESVKGIVLEAELFAVENELLTPTLKMRRQQLLAKYKPAFSALYATFGESDPL